MLGGGCVAFGGVQHIYHGLILLIGQIVGGNFFLPWGNLGMGYCASGIRHFQLVGLGSKGTPGFPTVRPGKFPTFIPLGPLGGVTQKSFPPFGGGPATKNFKTPSKKPPTPI